MRLQWVGHPFTSLPPPSPPEGAKQRLPAPLLSPPSHPTRWANSGSPPLPQLPQFLQREMIDEDNNAACLAPSWRTFCELMEAFRLCTWGQLHGCPGTPIKLGWEGFLRFAEGTVQRTAERNRPGGNKAVWNTNNNAGLTLTPGSVRLRTPLHVATRTAWS